MYEIAYKRRAAKALRRLPRNVAQRILAKIEAVAHNPSAPEHDIVPLRGRPGHRLRVGDWRVLFLIRNEELIILVVDILPRGDAYK